MKSTFNSSDNLNKWLNDFPKLKIILVHSEKEFLISNMQSGIVIVHAPWSGPSHQNMSIILSTLNSVNTNECIYIVDIDTISNEFVKTVFDQNIHGYAEAVYVVNGKVVMKHLFKHTFEQFLD